MYGQNINPNDPLFTAKNTLIESCNYLHDKMRDEKDRIYTKIYFAVSLILTIMASFFVKALGLMPILILIDLSMGLLIIFAGGYYKQKKRFWENRTRIKKSFKDYGLEWRG